MPGTKAYDSDMDIEATCVDRISLSFHVETGRRTVARIRVPSAILSGKATNVIQIGIESVRLPSW